MKEIEFNVACSWFLKEKISEFVSNFSTFDKNYIINIMLLSFIFMNGG